MATKMQNRIWEEQVDKYVRQVNYLKQSMKTVYSLVWRQCTDFMRQKVEAVTDFEIISGTGTD
jgi:hypothetical protein